MTLQGQQTRRRELASAVKRLRVAATSDPGKSDDLADALVELTACRLLAWDFAEAATDAPESVLLAARLLAAHGPTGPYASMPDAVRYLRATAQLAAIQAGLGQAEAAGRTLEGLDAWRAQVSRLPLAANVPAETAIWLLLARARAVLEADPARANAWADAAEERLFTLTEAPPALAIATHLLTADARWNAGRTESALAHHRLALAAHTEAVTGVGPSSPPAVRRAAAAPVPALHEPYAERLEAGGDRAGGIAVRRSEVALLRGFGDQDLLPAARAGLAAALAAVGREIEAQAERGAGAGEHPRHDVQTASPPAPTAPAGPRLTWEPAPAAEALAPQPQPDAVARWQQAEQAAVFAGVAARTNAERAEASLRMQAEADAARRAAEQQRAARETAARLAATEAAQAHARQQEAARAAERAAREEEAARSAAEERRRLLAAEHRQEVDPDVALAARVERDRARRAVHAAGTDPQRLAAAHEWLADVLRPLAALDPTWRPELAASLEMLVRLRWQLGDADGSRAAAREAKGLG